MGDRHDFIEPVAGNDKAAGMLRKMARETFELFGERQHFFERPGVEPEAADLVLRDSFRGAAPERARQRRDDVFRQSESLADVAQRRAAAIGDDARGKAGAGATVARINILHHLFAPLVLEIDIDVGRLLALDGDEALEQKLVARRIDLGDAEAEAERGIGGRTAPLTEDSLGARKTHDVVHGEKVGRIVQRRHEL